MKLTGASSFREASLTLGAGAKLWIVSGVTLHLTGNASPGLINVTGANAGIYGEGTIDAKCASSGTTMIHSSGDKFELYKVHLHNSQMTFPPGRQSSASCTTHWATSMRVV